MLKHITINATEVKYAIPLEVVDLIGEKNLTKEPQSLFMPNTGHPGILHN